MSFLQQGDKLLIVHRRLFEGDESRYFVGEVDAHNDVLVQVTGFSWIQEHTQNTFIQKSENRTKIFSLSSGTFIVYKLDNSVDFKSLEIAKDGESRTVMKDKNKIIMDLTERIRK